jgi:hypothetical protein
VHGVRLALRDARFADDKLVHVLLAHELQNSVNRAFGTTTCAHQGYGGPPQGPHQGQGGPYGQGPYGSDNPYGGGGPSGPGGPGGMPPGFHQEPQKPGRRGFWAGCAAFVGLCCTCKLCCAEEYEGPWSRKKREGCCHKCDCDCCECCSCDC